MNSYEKPNHVDLVDRVLAGKDPETKARTLDLIYRLRLEPTDELFLFCVAIGYLETIIVDAPEQWEAVFANFRTNLDQWKINHLKTLETSSHLADQIEQMTRSLMRQTNYMNDIASGLQAMLKQSANMTAASTDWVSVSRTLSKRLDECSEDQSRLLKREIQKIGDAILTPAHPLKTLQQEPSTRNIYATPTRIYPTPYPMSMETPFTLTSSTGRAVSVLMAVLLLVTGGSLWLLWKQQQATSWLLFKATRQECRLKVVSSKSAQCAPFR